MADEKWSDIALNDSEDSTKSEFLKEDPSQDQDQDPWSTPQTSTKGTRGTLGGSEGSGGGYPYPYRLHSTLSSLPSMTPNSLSSPSIFSNLFVRTKSETKLSFEAKAQCDSPFMVKSPLFGGGGSQSSFPPLKSLFQRKTPRSPNSTEASPAFENINSSTEEVDTIDNRLRVLDCVREGKTEILEILLKKNVNPNYEDESGITPLIYAIRNQKIELIEHLTASSKININYISEAGVFPLLEAVKLPHSDLSLKIIKLLLNAPGIDVNMKDLGGYTPLAWATHLDNLVLVKVFLDSGADPNLSNHMHVTPMHIATRNKNGDIVLALLAKGPIKLVKDFDGKLPIDLTNDKDFKNLIKGYYVSYSHPLPVQFVEVIIGKLGYTSCPGRCDGNWRRNLDKDINVLKSKGCNIFVSLLSVSEFEELGCNATVFKDKLAAQNIKSINLIEGWKRVVPSLKMFTILIYYIIKRLRREETVIIHDRNGTERNGLTLAACLIVFGLSLERSIESIRNIEPQQLTLPTQLTFLKQFDELVKCNPNSLGDIAKNTMLFSQKNFGASILSSLDDDMEFLDQKDVLSSNESFLGEVLEGWTKRKILLVISAKVIQFQDPKTKYTFEVWAISQIKAWGAHPTRCCIVLDFGDFGKNGKIVVKTEDPHRIVKVISRFVYRLVEGAQRDTY